MALLTVYQRWYTVHTAPQNRPSSFSIRAADMAAAAYVPIQSKCTGLTYSVANKEARRVYSACVKSEGTTIEKLNQR